jgi:hypothetical protein
MRAIWTGMTLFMLAGLAGVFGRGVLSKATASAGSALVVKYERLLHFRTPADIEITWTPPRTGTVQLNMQGDCFKKARVQRVIPQPISSEPLYDGSVYSFPRTTLGSPMSIRISQEPGAVGPVTCELRAEGVPPVRLSQFILP